MYLILLNYVQSPRSIWPDQKKEKTDMFILMAWNPFKWNLSKIIFFKFFFHLFFLSLYINVYDHSLSLLFHYLLFQSWSWKRLFHPKVKWFIQRFERVKDRISGYELTTLFNQRGLNEKVLYTYIYIYIYIYVCVCMCVCVCWLKWIDMN